MLTQSLTLASSHLNCSAVEWRDHFINTKKPLSLQKMQFKTLGLPILRNKNNYSIIQNFHDSSVDVEKFVLVIPVVTYWRTGMHVLNHCYN
jgi:hypothetical protein